MRLDDLPESELREGLRACCGSARWITAMIAARPYHDAERLHTVADHAATALEKGDWLEAFGHHPRIGDVEALRVRFAHAGSQSWSRGEQAGVAGSDDAVLERLAEGNRRYENRFGYLFIVCASGKTAAEMLALLEERLTHGRAEELGTAAAEQMKITHLRLDKWLRELES